MDVTCFIYILMLMVIIVSSTPVNNRTRSDFLDLLPTSETFSNIQSYGYEAQVHEVVTPDGYILEVHRIPYNRHETTSTRRRPAVFIFHGFLGASNNFLFLGPENSIAYNLADAGFDVWMGNARGTRNSRRHLSLNPDDPNQKAEFFDFTFDEIGSMDVASSVDYILNLTGNKKLHYIGHSQGGTSFLVLNSLRPEYNDKFLSAHLLAGVGYTANFPNEQLRTIASYTSIIYQTSKWLGIVELFPPTIVELRTSSDGVAFKSSDYCAGNVMYKEFCKLMGFNQINTNLEEYSTHHTGGASIKQLAHFGQLIYTKEFKRFDHGSVKNLEVYGTTTPPFYDLSLITANVTMHYTLADHLLDERDVLAMANDMPNTVARKVERDTFTHSGFILEADVKELVTEHIIEFMNSMIVEEVDNHAVINLMNNKIILVFIGIIGFLNK